MSDTVEKPPVTDDINWIQHKGFHNLSDINPVIRQFTHLYLILHSLSVQKKAPSADLINHFDIFWN